MKKFCIVAFVFFSPLYLWSQLLWEIKGNGLRRSSYLLATNKYLSQDFLDSIDGVYTCFEKCECVVTEFEMQDYEALAALRVAAVLPDSHVLSEYYTKAEYAEIRREIEFSLGFKEGAIDRMRPSYVMELYRNERMRERFNWDEMRSMANFFAVVGTSQQKPLLGLDSREETLYMMFSREPFEAQIKELSKMLHNPNADIDLEENLLQLYRQGRLNDMAYLVQSPDNASSVSFSDYQVYYKRNKEWVKRLGLLLENKRCFITLDALYLGGEKGLIHLLSEAGYTVKAYNTRRRIE